MRSYSILTSVLVALVMAGSASESFAQPEPAGAPTVLLDSTGAFFMQPRWSPGAGQLAVTGSGYTGIWLLNRADGGLRQVTDAPAAGFGMTWAPDGAALLTRVARFEGKRRSDAVAVFDTQGSKQLLTEYRDQMPALPQWSPDGRRVVLPGASPAASPEVLQTSRPAVPASRSNVLYASGRRIRAAQAETGGDVRNVAAQEMGRVLNVTPSPDGTKVAYEVMGGPLFVMDADGTNRVELGPGHRPSWAPGGQWVVFSRNEDDGYRITASDLHAARADGSAHVQLTDTPGRLEMNPAWSPDGDAIAFDDHAGRIWLLPMASGE